MKPRKFLLFLSPLAWNYSNKQLQHFAEKLSEDWRVFFLDTSRLPRISIREFFFSSKKRKQAFIFLKQLFSSRSTLWRSPVIFTTKSYEYGEYFNPIDNWLFSLQLYVFAFITSQSLHITVWANTTIFPEVLKKIRNTTWYYDFFDRFFDFTFPSNNQVIQQNEKWLLTHAEVIFINTTFYASLIEKFGPPKKQRKAKVVNTPVGYYVTEHVRIMPKKSSKVVVGYEGAISARFDYKLIEKIISHHSQVQFLFIGPVEENKQWLIPTQKENVEDFVKRLKSYPNVSFQASHHSHRQRVLALKQFTIGWIPYDPHIPFNTYSNPTKFYEYTAVGLPVISTHIPVLKERKVDTLFIRTAQDFSRALRVALQKRTKNHLAARKAFARHHDIDQKYEVVKRVIQ